MSDILDKAILIGIGLEKKAKEVLDELQQAGKTGAPQDASAQGLSAKQVIENKVVEEGVKTLKEFLSFVKAGKEKLEKEMASSSDKVLGKLNVATHEEMDIIKEMARIAREKADRLEKRVEALEARLGKD